MTPEQIALVQTSFAQVVPISDTAATIFYERLFSLDPSLRQLFSKNLRGQRVKLMAMLATAVNNLNQWGNVADAVRRLGIRHVDYGAKSSDYDTVGKALIGTLETGLGDAFTPEVRSAWLACYTMIAGEMTQAAAQHETAGA